MKMIFVFLGMYFVSIIKKTKTISKNKGKILKSFRVDMKNKLR